MKNQSVIISLEMLLLTDLLNQEKIDEETYETTIKEISTFNRSRQEDLLATA